MLFFIILLGLLLRLSFINKPEGLWNDEYVSWYVANTPFNNGFWEEVVKQCHMPLYYLYLKPFAHCSDLILRITSVIPGVLAIFVMYLAGMEFSKKTALYSASITSVLSFLIYYSQEVRFYSLLFFFTSLCLLFTIRLLKNNSKANIAGYIISCTLILATHVLGGIYVLFNSIYIVYKKKKISLKLTIFMLTAFFILLPFGINILRMLPASQWWGIFSYTNILFLFSDFLSPILTNNVNAPPVFFYNKAYTLWMLLPLIIVFLPFIYGLKKLKGLASVSALTIIVMSILAAAGKLVFITKYSIEILPVLILIIASGFTRLKKTGLVLLIIFISIHLCAFFSPYYATKIKRSEGNRIPAEIVKARKPDTIIFTYYEPDRFERYIDLTPFKTAYISKINRFEYREKPEEILKDIKIGETVSIILLDSVSFFNEDIVKANARNPKIPEMFLTFSHIKNCLIKELDKKYTDFKADKIGSWTVITAKRYK